MAGTDLDAFGEIAELAEKYLPENWRTTRKAAAKAGGAGDLRVCW